MPSYLKAEQRYSVRLYLGDVSAYLRQKKISYEFLVFSSQLNEFLQLKIHNSKLKINQSLLTR